MNLPNLGKIRKAVNYLPPASCSLKSYLIATIPAQDWLTRCRNRPIEARWDTSSYIPGAGFWKKQSRGR